MANTEDKSQNKKSISQESLNRSLEYLKNTAPKGGYAAAIKKKYFKPKTDWAMLGVFVALASLFVTAIMYLLG